MRWTVAALATLIEWGEKVAASGRRGADLSALSATITALPPAELPTYLQQQAPLLFKENAVVSLWFFEVDALFPRRTALLRVMLAMDTMPDFLDATDHELPQIQTLQEHSLTGGIATETLVEPLLLAIPPLAPSPPCARQA